MNTIISHEPELKNEIRETFYNMDKLLAQYPYSKDWIRDLKGRGYQVLYLSNWSQHLIDQSPRSVDFIPLMDGGIFSYKVKLVKPDHQIYKKLIDSYKLNPNECVFLDDKKENIHAAKECGLNGIIVESYAQSSSELEKLLLEK